jgi:hypothetical protein
MLAKIFEFVKANRANIMVFILVLLLTLFSFACGYIIAKYQTKPPIEISNIK